jgi:uncharacterized membrane protein
MRLEVGSGDRVMVLTHYYRAMVSRADVWRMRMDSTTNWAIVATAGVVSFALGDPGVAHYVVFISTLLTISFLLLEARRLTFYRFWQRRALLLEKTLLRGALSPESQSVVEDERLLGLLEADLGRTVPQMPLLKAVARRLRRIYLYLFGVQLLAWALKLGSHPTPATSASELITRAHIGPLDGWAVVLFVGLQMLGGVVLALAYGGVSQNGNEASG